MFYHISKKLIHGLYTLHKDKAFMTYFNFHLFLRNFYSRSNNQCCQEKKMVHPYYLKIANSDYIFIQYYFYFKSIHLNKSKVIVVKNMTVTHKLENTHSCSSLLKKIK